ncbi:MAG: right-handed parallel beta-helix repeat-containing protein [Candidatus Eisenbacteria bacterium]|nr:right-handed parallel beta-helix repeat-containing protein [Candidatus Eisenbacteria bacterium]
MRDRERASGSRLASDRIEFGLSQGGAVDLAVFDDARRRVRVSLDGTLLEPGGTASPGTEAMTRGHRSPRGVLPPHRGSRRDAHRPHGGAEVRAAITAACALLVVAVGSRSEVHAREWRVRLDGTGDFTSNREAIGGGIQGDSILIGSGDYSAEDFLYFRESPWVSGEEGGEERPILPRAWINVSSGFELSNIRILSSPAGTAATIWARNVVIQGSEFSGGAYRGLTCASDSALISECAFMGNATHPSGESRGGGLRLATNGDAPSHHVVDGCTFIDNTTGRSGGAIYVCPSNEGGSVIEIRNCFSGERGSEAAAIDVGYWEGVPRITNKRSSATKSLDAAIHFDGLDAYITNNIFAFNECFGYWVWQLGSADATSSGATGPGDSDDLQWGGHCTWGEGRGPTRSSIPGSATGARATTR